MRDRQTAPAVFTVHLTRHVVLVALLGVVAIVVGLFAPLSAQAGDNQGGGVDPSAKPWVCHPVVGAGETGDGWNLVDPSKDSSHIDEATGAGQHTRKDGSTDRYAVWNGTSWTCRGGPTSPTTEPTGTTSDPTETTTEPTGTTSTEAPETGATEPSTTSTSPAAPAAIPQEPATVAPRTPARTAPELGRVEENAVPRAQTDGADLVGAGGGPAGWTALQATLVGAGVLLLVASGLLSVRRQRPQE